MNTTEVLKRKFLRMQALQRVELSKHFDSNETPFLERELTQLRNTVMQVLFPDAKARTFASKATDIAPSAETYSYKVLKRIGAAKIGGNYTDDVPRIDVGAVEVFGKVRPVIAAYGFSINELREAARLNVPLSDVKATQCKEAIERGIDQVLAFGDLRETTTQTNINVAGLVNNPDVVNNGITSGLNWFANSPPTTAQVLAEVNLLIAGIAISSKGLFAADTFVLPTKQYEYLSQTPYSSINPMSLLKVVLENNSSMQRIEPWYQLDTAGAGSLPRGMVYQNKKTILEAVIPLEFEQMPPETRGFEIVVDCHARSGGVKWYQPVAGKYIDWSITP